MLKSKPSLFFIGIALGALSGYLFIFNYINVLPVKEAPSTGQYTTFSLSHDSIIRTYDVYVPESLEPDSPVLNFIMRYMIDIGASLFNSSREFTPALTAIITLLISLSNF